MNKAFLLLGTLVIAASGFLAWKYAMPGPANVSGVGTSTSSVIQTTSSLQAATSSAIATSSIGRTTSTTNTPSPIAAPGIISNQSVYQGDTIFITFTHGTPVSATFNGNPMHIFEFGGAGRAIYPVLDIFTPGSYKITADFGSGKIVEKNIQVLDYKFAVYQMGQPGGTPDPEIEAKLETQAADFNSTFVGSDTSAAFTKTFVPPLHTALKITSPYGEVREYTGGGASRHLGVDFAAPVGTPVYAINTGTVVKIRNYLSYGNIVIIDHGAGIYSMYLHLSKFEVKEGDKVLRNQEIALSGATGYETGPHLHLSLKIGGISVDPMKFIDTVK